MVQKQFGSEFFSNNIISVLGFFLSGIFLSYNTKIGAKIFKI